MQSPHGLYTIPSGQNFLKKLAQGLLNLEPHTQDRQSHLTKMRVLLPTRRAARGLRDAFLELNNHEAILLPRLQPLGDIDADELDLTLSGLGLDSTDIPPAIKSLERQFLLAQQVQRKDSNLSFDQCLSLAKNLATLIDQVHTESLDFANLPELVPYEDFSNHWQETLVFLEIVTSAWPLILAHRGQIDPAHRRALLMKALTELWAAHPPQTPIIAAGSTGSIPTTANLLTTIANLPQGAVILPGLDLGLDEESWTVIDDTHPQRTMKNLLIAMKKTRADIKLWPSCEQDDPPRRRLIRAIMRPAETFGKTLIDSDSLDDFHDNITICETANAREQAATIATALREVLNNEQKTACLVTPDRALARRVTTALKRWNIDADDSAGQSLMTTPSGIFISTLMTVLEEDFAPIPLLEFLKHPLFTNPLTAQEFQLAEFERDILRGSKPAPGLNGIERRITAQGNTEFLDLLKILRASFDTLIQFQSGIHAPLKMLIEITKIIESLAGGERIFWSQPESNSLSTLLSQLIIEARNLPPMPLNEWAGIIRNLMIQETFRETQPRHPRIVILGQLESRLIQHDVMILAGLNEGMWPSEPAHDPWMSRPMRKKFGLPPAARSIGLSAHDFTEGLNAEKVIITRAIKEDGTETVPARWLQRLSTLITASADTPDWTNTYLIHWTRELDAPTSRYTKPEAPQPCPPRYKRPEKLSATWIEKWMNNPYRVYAHKILRLKRVNPLEDDAIFTDRGTLIHDILESFVQQTPHGLDKNSKDLFMTIAQEKLSEVEALSPHWHYWWPRMDKIADWFISTETEWRKDALPWRQEIEGFYKIYDNPQTKRSFTLTAKADRIDRLKTGGAAIIDYKTGIPPSNVSICNGLSPQLPLEGLILSKGGFEEQRMEINELAYWKVAHNGETKRLSQKKLPFSELIPAAEEGLLNLVLQFEDPTTPYIAFPPKGQHIYEDDRAYAHLARVGEWSVIGGDEETDTREDE
ncbi:MAG: double-strand break repair protein AddB [Alphaproteobacteria bacterium]|nr:double-strand break repair protein AddB [Alphaproteobacteria bacterium]